MNGPDATVMPIKLANIGEFARESKEPALFGHSIKILHHQWARSNEGQSAHIDGEPGQCRASEVMVMSPTMWVLTLGQILQPRLTGRNRRRPRQ